MVARPNGRAHHSLSVEAGGSMLSEWKAGIHFLWSRRPLFILIVQVAVFGFRISSAYALTTYSSAADVPPTPR
jgi:hypothetical protein